MVSNVALLHQSSPEFNEVCSSGNTPIKSSGKTSSQSEISTSLVDCTQKIVPPKRDQVNVSPAQCFLPLETSSTPREGRTRASQSPKPEATKPLVNLSLPVPLNGCISSQDLACATRLKVSALRGVCSGRHCRVGRFVDEKVWGWRRCLSFSNVGFGRQAHHSYVTSTLLYCSRSDGSVITL